MEKDELGFVLSHPSGKNKDAARVGHPAVWGRMEKDELGFAGSQVPNAGPGAPMALADVRERCDGERSESPVRR